MIQLTAIDRRDRSTPAELRLMTVDSTAPTWPLEAQIQFIQNGQESGQVRWPAAEDNVAVTGYRVEVDGDEAYRGDHLSRYVDLSRLRSDQPHEIAVYAHDRLDQWSEPLAISVTLTDQSPPSWPLDATLSLEALSETELAVTWPPAQDNTGVTAYLIYVDNTPPIRVSSDQGLYRLSGLDPWTSYLVRVVAEDAEALVSQVGLVGEMRTLDNTRPRLDQEGPLSLLQRTSTAALLGWSRATDNGSIIGYQIKRDGVIIGELPSSEFEYRVSELNPGMTYEFSLKQIWQSSSLIYL